MRERVDRMVRIADVRATGETRLALLLVLLAALAFVGQSRGQDIPADSSWTANAELRNPQARTIPGLGAAQGVSFFDDKVYLYGDVWKAQPRVGVIREYNKDFEPPGRVVWLRRDGKTLVQHPTGLT